MKKTYRPLLNHLLPSKCITIPHSHKVHIKHPAHILLTDLQRRRDLSDPGIGDHHVQRTEGFDGFVDHVLDGGSGGDVGDDTDGGAVSMLGVERGDEGVDAGFLWGGSVGVHGDGKGGHGSAGRWLRRR